MWMRMVTVMIGSTSRLVHWGEGTPRREIQKDTKKPKRLARESPQAQGILARPAPSRPKFGGFQTITYGTTHGATAPTKSWILNFV